MKLASILLLALAALPVQAQQSDTGAHSPATAQAPAVAPGSATERVDAAANASLGADQVAGHETGHEAAAEHGARQPDIIMPHITDSHHLEIPWPNSHWAKEIELPRWAPVHIGPLVVDLSPTKHVVMLALAALLCALTLTFAGVAHERHTHAVGHPKGFAAGIEATVLYIRNEVILKNVGPHGEGFVPYMLTVFFFILFANFLGLIPYLSTATGNISVTATLAVMSFIVIEVAGMRALGKGYLNTIFYWPKDEPFGVMKVVLFLILSPVELLGKFTKPFALAIRLFANMTAGHIVVLALIGLIFLFKSIASGAPFIMAVLIMVLELFVALLQAYIFTLLSSVFIGIIREGGH
jgi:F-type H+-transporting ATPase subunit a